MKYLQTPVLRKTVLGLAFSLASSYGYARDANIFLDMGEGAAPKSGFEYQYQYSAKNSDRTPTITNHREDGQFIISKKGPDTWSIQEHFDHFHINSPVTIPATGVSVPSSLNTFNMGISYGHRMENGKNTGFNFNVGSASDHLFQNRHVLTVRATANYRVPSQENNAWLFFLSYSNNRHFANNIPLPGIGYFFNTPKLKTLIGFPFISLFVLPTPRWTAEFSIFGPRNVNFRTSYAVFNKTKLYTGFNWGQQQWFLANQSNSENHLFFQRKRLLIGINTPLSTSLLLDVSGGHEFDRRFYANNSNTYQHSSTANLSSTDYIGTKLSYQFGQKQESPIHLNPK